MVRIESLSTQPKFDIGQSVDGQLSLRNHEKPLAGKVALVTSIARGVGDEIAIALAQEGVRILGIAGNSRKQQREAKSLEIEITDRSGGDIEFVHVNLNTLEGRKEVQRRVEKIDIFVLPYLVTGGNNTLIDDFLPQIRKGGMIILIGQEDEAMESLRKGVQIMPEFNEKEISFSVVCPPVERIGEVGEKSVVS